MNNHPNKPCYCGSGKKYKKCHKIIDYAHEEGLTTNKKIEYEKYSRMLEHGEEMHILKEYYVGENGGFDREDFMSTYELSEYDMESLEHYKKYDSSGVKEGLIKMVIKGVE